MVPLSVVDLMSAEDRSSESQGRSSHDGRLGRHKVSVVESNLAQVRGHVLNLSVISLLGRHELLEKVDGGVANRPLECVENVHLHLGEHAGII